MLTTTLTTKTQRTHKENYVFNNGQTQKKAALRTARNAGTAGKMSKIEELGSETVFLARLR